MIARIFKWLVIGVIALIVVAIWAGTRFFNGIDLGGAGHSPSSNFIEDYINKYQARKTKMEKMEQLQASLEFVCKHEEKPELSVETQQLYNSMRCITTCTICGRANGAMRYGTAWHVIIVLQH
ncbi:hypothetical protein [Rodentibacter sp. Ppn85]|uniref:hypothetical protein n=1 Tax=Rodentibacter sp. Ppn85 TaxID=1908525 RepID=UPI0026A909D8